MKLKTIHFFWWCFLFCLVSCHLQGQSVKIGDTDLASETSAAPFTIFYKYSASQVLYTAQELSSMSGKQITSLSYRLNNQNTQVPSVFVEVYMALVDETSFSPTGSNIYQFIPFSGMTKVFSGNYAIPTAGENILNLETPFTYDGSKSLLITFIAPEKLSATPNNQFRCSPTPSLVQTLYYQNDNTPYADGSEVKSLMKRPNTTFYYRDKPTGPVLNISPTVVDFGYVKMGEPSAKEVQISNLGVGTLSISTINNLASPFSSAYSGISLTEDAVGVLPFTYTPVSEESVQADVEVVSTGGTEALILKGESYGNQGLVEDFETEGIPDLWRSLHGQWSIVSANSYSGSKQIKAGSTVDTLITPKISGGRMVFFAKYAQSSSSSLEILSSTDLKTYQVLKASSEMPLESNYKYYSIDLSTQTGESFIALVAKNIYLDYCLLSQAIRPTKDLYLSSFSPLSAYQEKTVAQIPIKVKNWGSSEAASFRIQLLDGQTDELLLDTLIEERLASKQEREHHILWSPLPKVASIYTKLIYDEDSDLSNNTSAKTAIKVTPYVGVLKIVEKSLNFDVLASQESLASKSIVLENTGIAPLIISRVKASSPFSAEESSFTIEPKARKNLNILFSRTTPDYYEDSLIFVFEGLGDSIVYVKGIDLAIGALFESFEENEFPPFMWRKSSGESTKSVWKGYNSSSHAYHGNYSAYQENRSDLWDTLITPKLRVSSKNKLIFYAKHWGNEKAQLELLYSADMQTWTSLKKYLATGDGKIIQNSMSQFMIELPEGEYYIGFAAMNEVMLDYVCGPEIVYPDHDLKLISQSIPKEGNVNYECNLLLSIQNVGNLVAKDYMIYLMNGQEVLAKFKGDSLSKMEKKEMTFAYIPNRADTLKEVYFKIVYEADEDISNNVGPYQSILVRDEFFSEFLIAETSSTDAQIPYATNYKYSMIETLYYAEELGFTKGSKIKEFSYFYHSPTKFKKFPVNIWIGELDEQRNLTEWIQTSDLEKVWDGDSIEIEANLSKVIPLKIKLKEPYVYQGGHLLILFERPYYNDSEFQTVSFLSSNPSSSDKRTLSYKTDSEVTYDPMMDISFSPTASNACPMILFSVDKQTVNIKGKLVSDDEIPLPKAIVSFKYEAVRYIDTTDTEGNFEFKMSVLNKEYTFDVLLDDYVFTPRKVYIADTNMDLGKLIVPAQTYTCQFNLSSVNEGSLKATSIELKSNISVEVFRDTVKTEASTASLIFTNLSKGTYSLSIKHLDFKSFQSSDFLITKDTLVDIRLTERDSVLVQGRVLAGYNKEALADAQLRFTHEEASYSTKTDTAGRFSFKTNKLGRSYIVSISKTPSFKPLTATFGLSAEGKDTILPDYALELVNIIYTFHVKCSDASSSDGAKLRLYLPNTKDTLQSTVQGGKAVFDNLIPGKYHLAVSKDTYLPYLDTMLVIIESGSKDIVLQKRKLKPSLTLYVKTSTDESTEGLEVFMENNYTGAVYEKTLDKDGKVYFDNLLAGTYSLEIFKNGFEKFFEDSLSIEDSLYKEIVLQEVIIAPYALEAEVEYNDENAEASVMFSWNDIGEYYLDSYEDYEDFALTFEPWILMDKDGLGVVAFSGKTYLNMGVPQAATIFNPFAMNPIFEDAFALPYSGKKAMAFFGSVGVANDDWAISPKRMIRSGDVLAFVVKQLAEANEAERFAVYISTKEPLIEDFVKLSEGNYLTVGSEEWSMFVADLSMYVGKEVYVGIHCTSRTQMMLMLDDFYIGKPIDDFMQKAPKGVLSRVESAYSLTQASMNKGGEVLTYSVYLDDKLVQTTDKTYFKVDKLSPGNHVFGVKASYKSGDSKISTLAFEVDDLKVLAAKFTLDLTTNAGELAEGAKVYLRDSASGREYLKTFGSDKMVIPYLRKATYLLKIEKEGFQSLEETFQFTQESTLSRKLIEIILKPVNAFVKVIDKGPNLADAEFSWNIEAGDNESFESYADFTQSIPEWTNIDKDAFPTYGISNCTFPGMQQPMAALVFNPSATTPSIARDEAALSHTGSKHIVFISSDQGAADDWLISPQKEIRNDYKLRFFAKSYSDTYGKEKLKVLISTTDKEEASFTEIASLELPTQWTEYTYDLSEYAGKSIYIAFHYVSNNIFYMLLDDVYVGSKEEIEDGSNSRVKNYKIFLNGELKATQKENKYTFSNLVNGDYEAAVQAEYVSGVSEKASYKFKVEKVSNEIPEKTSSISLYPNPAGKGESLYVESTDAISSIKIFSMDGRQLDTWNYSQSILKTELSVEKLNSGVYVIEIRSTSQIKSSKLIIK